MNMDLKKLFNEWAQMSAGRYRNRQWLLSKWDVQDGVQWSQEKIDLLLEDIRVKLDFESGCERFLDLGCGGGWLLDALGGLSRRSVGCDLSIEMLRQTSGQFPVVNADACCLPFPDKVFDRILCYFVLINFEDEESLRRAISEMVRVLESGGRILAGQIPDAEQSGLYDKEKERYAAFCRRSSGELRDCRDCCHIPVFLFHRDMITDLFEQTGCVVHLLPSFNPFYRAGEPKRIPWRFDVIAQKP